MRRSTLLTTRGGNMRTLLFVLGLVSWTHSALADGRYPTGYDPVAEDRQEAYIKATSQSFVNQPKSVQACDYRWIQTVLYYPDDILVAKKAAQPLLIYNKLDLSNSQIMYRMTVQTASDLKTIQEVHAQVFALEETNTGDLANPVYVEDWVKKSDVNCTVK